MTTNKVYALILGVLITGSSIAVNLVDGEILYKESCIQCHGIDEDLSENSLMDSVDPLKEKIFDCIYRLDIPWNEHDIADTAGYLDIKYYHFKDWE